MVVDQGQSTISCSVAPNSQNGCRLPYLRFLVAFMTVSCAACCYIGRQNLSMAYLAMTQPPKGEPDDEYQDETFGPKYDWTGTRVIGAFYWTYVASQIPGARVAETLGPKWVLFTAGFGTAILSCLSPFASSLESTEDWSFYAVRLLLGVCQGAIFPACYTILTNWLPITERQIALPIMNANAFIGCIIAIISTGFFSKSDYFTWEWAYYFPGIVCFIWSAIWIFIATNKPDEHQCISKKELNYIDSNKGDAKSTTSKLDWAKLASSRQVWGVIIAFLASNYSFSLMLTMLPYYLKSIHKVPTSENVKTNVILYSICIVSAPLIGAASSYLIKNRTFGLSCIAVRKIFQSLAVWGQAVCFLVIIKLGTQTDLVTWVLYLQMFSYSFVNGGEVHLPTEISAEFGGTIYAIANCVGSCCGFIIPSMLDWIVEDKTNIEQWNTFLYVAAGFSFVGNSLYVLIAGNSPEDLSADSPINTSNGTFKAIDRNESELESRLTSKRYITKDTHIEMTEMDKINKKKSTNRDYESISRQINNNAELKNSSPHLNERKIS